MERKDQPPSEGKPNNAWEQAMSSAKDFATNYSTKLQNEELKANAKAEPTNYEQRPYKRFEREGFTVEPQKWAKLYDRQWDESSLAKDPQERAKAIRYRNEVLEKIAQWNSLPFEARIRYVETGEYDESLSDMVSLLTSARVLIMDDHTEEPPTPPNPPIPPISPDPPTPPVPPIIPIPPTPPVSPLSPEEDPVPPIPPEEDPVPPIPPKEPLPPENPTPPVDPLPPVPETGETGEAVDEREVYEIIKQLKQKDLPPPVAEAVATIGAAGTKALIALVPLLVSLALFFGIDSPFSIAQTPPRASIYATGAETIQVDEAREHYTPEQKITTTITAEDSPVEYARLQIEKFLSEASLGSNMHVYEGTRYWESPDHDFGGADRNATIGPEGFLPEGDYLFDRFVALDSETGEYVENLFSGDGDRGNLGDLITTANNNHEGQIETYFHINDESGDGVGWVDSNDAVRSMLDNVDEPLELEVTIPEETNVEHYSGTRTEDIKAHGETDDLSSDGIMTITDEDGVTSTVCIKNADGMYKKVGDSIVDSKGRVLTIKDIDIDGPVKSLDVDWVQLALDAAAIAGVATGIYLSIKSLQLPTYGVAGAGGEATKEEREMMELNGAQLKQLVDIFSEEAGQDANIIADRLAGFADLSYEDAHPNDIAKNSVLGQMDESQREVALALLKKRDEATLKHLSEMLGLDLDEYAERILSTRKEQK